MCKHVASVRDYQKAGAPEDCVAFSCIGRWLEGSLQAFEESGLGPCNYAGGGLFRLNPVEIIDGEHTAHFFDFDRSEDS